MENQNQDVKTEGKGCCGTKSCRCCGKALAVLALLAIGGLGGWALGKHCPVKDVPAAASPAK